MSISIGEVARLTGLSIYTLRYYDDLGWINVIKCLRATQMSLSDMQCFTELAQQGVVTVR